MRHVIGLSGGKDSTALALALQKREPRDYEYICTPTGNELPEMVAWWNRLEVILGKPIIRVINPKVGTLNNLIHIMGMIPNNRARFCTRILKIEPTIAWCLQNGPVRLYVGLRADEDEREGIYGGQVESDFPFKRWGWRERHIWLYLRLRGLENCIPARTDCDYCYDQKIREWWTLWKFYPDRWEEACQHEDRSPGGYTFRSKTRDTWPASLREMAKEFERGRKIIGGTEPKRSKCRACSL